MYFFDVPNVLSAWHKYYDSLHQKNQTNALDTWRQLRTELLSKMSLHLGYRDLTHYDIEKHYYPEGHENQYRSDWEFRTDQHEYYKSAVVLNKLLYDLNTQTPELDQGEERKI